MSGAGLGTARSPGSAGFGTPPADVYYGRREEILKRREEQKHAILNRWFQYNLGQAPKHTRDELGSEL
jgi:hypothetical protein